MKRTAIITLLSLAITGAAWATPSNIISAPSGDVQPYGTFHLDIDNTTTMFLPQRSGGGSLPTKYGIRAGFFDAGVLQTEAGMDIIEPLDEPMFFHFKVAVPEGSINDTMPGIFLGGYDIGTKQGVTNYSILYGGFSKTMSFVGRFTIGYFMGNRELLTDYQGKADNHAAMFAFDSRLPKVNERLWFGVDYMGTHSLYGKLSFGLGWAFSENASLTMGYVRYNDKRVTPTDLYGNIVGQNMVTWQVDFDF